jgi:DUF4097 and DUF4098 domain-containing protein YvlB
MTTTLLFFLAGVLGTLATSFGASGTFHEEFHQTYALEAQGRVALENINGDVHITAWDRNEVKVDAVKRALSQERLQEARVVVETDRSAVTIKTRYPDQDGAAHPASVDYNIMVPRTARVDQVKLVNGKLEIVGMKGQVRASSVNGTIKATDLGGDVRLSTVSGRLEATFGELNTGKSIHIDSVNGSIELLLPMDAHADFRADTVSGAISNDFGLPMERGRAIGRHLSGALKGGGARISVSNVNGSIFIAPAWHGKRVKFT